MLFLKPLIGVFCLMISVSACIVAVSGTRKTGVQSEKCFTQHFMRNLQCTEKSNERSTEKYLSTRSKILVTTPIVSRYAFVCSGRCACINQRSTLCENGRVRIFLYIHLKNWVELEFSFF